MNNLSVTSEGEGGHLHEYGLQQMAILSLLALIALVTTFVEHKHITYLSEASIAIIFGSIAGLVYFFALPDQTLIEFNHTLFIFILLPIIIFREAFDLQKRHFFKNIFYVAMFGLLGTVLNFVFVTIFTIYLSKTGLFILADGSSISLDTYWSMYFGACISSKDSAVTLSILNMNLSPKVSSIIFGECKYFIKREIFNDLIVFSLQKSVEIIGEGLESFKTEWYTGFKLLGIIAQQIAVGLAIGTTIGLITTWITNKARFLVGHPTIVTGLIIYAGYLTFTICEAFHYSGVISVLVYGLILSHYLIYNIPERSSQCAKFTIRSLAYIAESFIYFYIGFTLWINSQYTNKNFIIDQTYLTSGDDFVSYTMIAFQVFLIIPISRFLSLIIIQLIAYLANRHSLIDRKISKHEFFIIYYSGLIRGIVSYALIMEEQIVVCLKESEHYEDCIENNNQLLYVQNATLFIVLFNTVFIGATLKFICGYSLRQIVHEVVSSESQEQPLLELKQTLRTKSKGLIKRLDENWIKPFLIFDYKNRKDELKLAKKKRQQEDKQHDHTNDHAHTDHAQTHPQNQQVSNLEHSNPQQQPQERRQTITSQQIEQVKYATPIEQSIQEIHKEEN